MPIGSTGVDAATCTKSLEYLVAMIGILAAQQFARIFTRGELHASGLYPHIKIRAPRPNLQSQFSKYAAQAPPSSPPAPPQCPIFFLKHFFD